jgi:hypothetical protein
MKPADRPRSRGIDDDPSISIEPRTMKKASVPPPPKDGSSPASDEPASITLEPKMSVHGIDPAMLARMKNALADSGEGEPVGSEAVSTDPAPTPPLTFPKRHAKMTLIGVGERPPPLPDAEEDTGTISTTRDATNTEVEETERRPAAVLESPITLTEPIAVPRLYQRDTEAEAKEDLTTRDAVELPPKTAKINPATTLASNMAPIAFAKTEKADTSPAKPSKPPLMPSKPPLGSKPPAMPSKPPLPLGSKPPTNAPVPPRPMPPRPSPAAETKAEEPAADATPSARARKATLPMLDAPELPRLPVDSDDASSRSIGDEEPDDDAKLEVAPHVKRTAYALAASFVLAGALASAFVVWEASSGPKHASVVAKTTAPSASAPPDEAPPPPATTPLPAEPPASTTAAKPAPPPITPPQPVHKPPPPAPKPPPPKPRATAKPPPPSAPAPKPKSTAFDPGAI